MGSFDEFQNDTKILVMHYTTTLLDSNPSLITGFAIKVLYDEQTESIASQDEKKNLEWLLDYLKNKQNYKIITWNQTPERVAQITEDEDVDAVAMSLLNGAHGTLFPRVVKAIKKKGINDVLVVGGGVIPDIDHKDLIKAGVKHVFGPGTPLPTIIDNITTGVSKLRKI